MNVVHNGSLSNHNNLRRNLVRDGIKIETENDSEIAAAYDKPNVGWSNIRRGSRKGVKGSR